MTAVTQKIVRRRDALAAFVFLAPFLVIYSTFLVYPFFKGLWISLHDWELAGDYREFIGFLNYRDLWADTIFWKAVGNTLKFVVMTVPAMTVLALALALAVFGDGRLKGALRSIFFMSSVFSVSVVTLIWSMVLSADNGLLVPLFNLFGVKPINFLGHPTLAMPSLALTTLWWGVGLPMALFLAALSQIPSELYEAAELDHAGRFTTLIRITLPSIRPTLLLVLVLQIVGQFQIFGQAHLMTQGGPANKTKMLVQYIYETSFRDWQVGYASAMSFGLFILMFGFTMLQLWLGRKGEE
ncbi:carbohydrate ABC transporter permease [Rhizobium sp. TRM95796]|uniref:carbohydrate ABC transporter permease n=1 Tax=Rhizobium sp. TRM95796 TaxID=2979862 RepID=UPI0021E82A7A|nr:sugar ABC transporter permease [Rhizobium sp. TRM95796]MCV3768767.1 sugar ABC transporter permease [Rhizobium sp. TRM95796]